MESSIKTCTRDRRFSHTQGRRAVVNYLNRALTAGIPAVRDRVTRKPVINIISLDRQRDARPRLFQRRWANNGEKRNPLEFYSRENAFIRFINLPLIDAIAILFVNAKAVSG